MLLLDANVRVAFVDDHPILLEGIASLFASRAGFEVVGRGGTADAALKIAREDMPELLLMDLSMPGNVFGTISEISRERPDTRIVVFTAFSSVDFALRALEAGATGFVLKGSTFGELFEGIEAVLRGEMFITHQYASQVMAGLRNRSKREELKAAVKLTVREKQIIGFLMQARTNREIAERLSLSEKTIKHYMTGLMNKLNARNRVDLVIAAKQGSLD